MFSTKHLLQNKTFGAAMDNSPLGKLPPELRNYIYKLAMGTGQTIFLLPNQTDKSKLSCYGIPRTCMALPQTCKQIHRESATLFFGSNSFNCRNIDHLKRFIKFIGEENAKAMRGPIIDYFAQTQIRLRQPTQPNKAGRDRLRVAYNLAKSYGWTSLKVKPMFKTNYRWVYHYPQFDILQPEEEWQGSDLNRWRDADDESDAIRSLGTKFADRVEHEIEAWKQILKELHQD